MQRNVDLTLFSLVHFIVDLCCIFMMTAFVVPLAGDRAVWLWCVVMYNLFAFAVQLPVGALGDVLGRPHRMAAAGCGLIAAAYGLLLCGLPLGLSDLSGGVEKLMFTEGPRWLLLTACVIAGIGNSCFHVGGGISTLGQSAGRAARPGIFVSTGAFGVYLAPKLASLDLGLAVGTAGGILLMLVCGGALLLADRMTTAGTACGTGEGGRFAGPEAQAERIGAAGTASEIDRDGLSRGLLTAGVICLLLTIVIRSWAGDLMGFQWRSVPLYGLLFALGIVAGKFLGGMVGDRLGWARTAAVSLLLSLALLKAGGLSGFGAAPVCGIAGVLLFNMTMPLTLAAIAGAMGPDLRGTAFGMTTFALFLGTLPSVFGRSAVLAGADGTALADLTEVPPQWLLPVLILISAGAVYAGIRIAEKK